MDNRIPVGTLLTVSAEYAGKVSDYVSTVLGYGRYGIQLTLPQLLNKVYSLPATTPIRCSFTSVSTNQLLAFNSYVMGYERMDPPSMVIALPQAFESDNRREALRFPVKLSATYVAQADEVYGERTQTMDVSLGGVQLLTHRMLPKGTPLSVTIELPDQSVVVSGTVAWSSFRGRRATAGVQFTRLGDTVRGALAKYLISLERQGRRPVN
ncbi:MAG TPA: PilZ domain-containing protein [Symbiobacteriaceae bacterium]|nr:PilZ domain-containing protein [Symbiobacteriaceae bacterium]